jgi:ATP-dependent helicase/DNAse subunit B
MNIITLPYGDAGIREKSRYIEEIISSRPNPPFIYNDILFLVPAARMRRAYGRLFLDAVERIHGSAALVQPEVRTLHQFLYRLYTKINGPVLMDENTRLILLEGVVKELITGKSSFGDHPDILAPSLSAVVANMLEQLSSAGITSQRLVAKIRDTDFSDKRQVTLLVNAYERYEHIMKEKNLLDPAGTLMLLADRFDPKWLEPYSRIIIDGINDIDEIQARLIRKIATHPVCTILVEAPSADSVIRAGEQHPLRLTKHFLGSIGLTPGPSATLARPEDVFLSEALFSDRPFAREVEKAPKPAYFKKNIRVLSAVSTREEVSLIAAEIKKSLQQGTAPDTILVTFPALDQYGPLVEELFDDFGIPYNRALGRQLSTSPVATAVLSLLRTVQEDFSGPALMRVVSSPFLKFGENPLLAPALDRLMRERRIAGGKQKLLEAFEHGSQDKENRVILKESLTDLFKALDLFSTEGSVPLAFWMKSLSELMVWSRIAARVETIKGPLNINLQAYKRLTETLASLGRAGSLFPEYRYTFSEWHFLLRKTFMHTRFQVPPEDEGGVQILGLSESRGHAWNEIYFGGLTDTKFPHRLPQNIFLPEATLESLGVRTLEGARMTAAHHFYRLLLSAESVTLCYPENEGDRPAVPCPFLEELAPLRQAGLINRGVARAESIQFSLKIEESRSIPELAKAIAINGYDRRMSDVLNAPIKGMAGIRSAIAYLPADKSLSAFLPLKRKFTVTELDTYLNCPYDYYVIRVLGMKPLEEVTEDISPVDRGSKVHAILRNFYLTWNDPITGENRSEALVLLRRLADSAFDAEAQTFRNRREKEMFLAVMVERFLDAEEKFWQQGMKPAYLERAIEGYQLVLSDGTDVELSGKIDRIDIDDRGNFMIVDYKTGRYPKPKMTIDQDIFQLPVYAAMARTTLTSGQPVLKTPVGLVYYDLAGRVSSAARDVVLFNKDVLSGQPSSKPKASARSGEEFGEIIKRSLDKARMAADGILAGDFAPRPQDENKCRFCPNGILCRHEEG